jgi:hypothetical protein
MVLTVKITPPRKERIPVRRMITGMMEGVDVAPSFFFMSGPEIRGRTLGFCSASLTSLTIPSFSGVGIPCYEKKKKEKKREEQKIRNKK